MYKLTKSMLIEIINKQNRLIKEYCKDCIYKTKDKCNNIKCPLMFIDVDNHCKK